MKNEEDKVYHPKHGLGKVSANVSESTTDKVSVEFKEGTKVVKKDDLRDHLLS